MAQAPLTLQAINTFAMGCASVNPKCRVRVIFINNYYDPPHNAQAAVLPGRVAEARGIVRNRNLTPLE